MVQARRFIQSKSVYEVVVRAYRGIPFPRARYIRPLLASILARIQRDNKVELHHYLFEGSHVHFILTAYDAESCRRFIAELTKKLTDAIKRLTGRTQLRLWERRASIILLPTLRDVIRKIGYVYSNPSNDNLVDSIAEYPGVSSWQAFQGLQGNHSLEAAHSQVVPWLRQYMIPKLPNNGKLTDRQDRFFESMFSERGRKVRHELRVLPNGWIRAFIPNASEAQIAKINEIVRQRILRAEKRNRDRREREGRRVMGVVRLRAQALLAPHTPKKRSRKIFVQTTAIKTRLYWIKFMRDLDRTCREIYQRWRFGDFSVPWPPGSFAPPVPIIANYLPAG